MLPIEGYAIAWIVHPGFDDGTRMSGLLILSELKQADLIAFEDDGFPIRQTAFVLTEAYGTGAPTAERRAEAEHRINGDESAHYA